MASYEELIKFSQGENDSNKKPKIKTAKVNVVVLGHGLNYYKTVNVDLSKDHTFELAKNKYTIKSEAMFLHPKRFRRNQYDIIFKEGETEPIHVKRETGITSKMLKTANESQAVRKAMKELFTSPFNIGGKKLVFLVIVVGVAAVAVLSMMGYIDLGSLTI